MSDVIGALITHFSAQSSITDLTGSRIYGGEMPNQALVNPSEPPKILVFRLAGGVDPDNQLPLQGERVDCFCYGETPRDADILRRAVRAVMRDIERNLIGNALVHNALVAGGPINLRDPDNDFPFVVQSFFVTADERAAA